MPHDAALRVVPRRCLVHQATVVPQHRVAGLPVVMIDARLPGREVGELLQEALGLVLVHARDVMGVAADHQVLAAGLGMDLDQRTQRHRPVVEAVAVVFAIGLLLRVMAGLGLAVVERVIGRELLDLRARRLIQRIISRAHVAEAGVAADRRHFLGGEHSALGLDGHVGRIHVPAHVALQHLHAIVVVLLEAQGAVRLDVAECRHLELERAQALGEGNLFCVGEELAREDEQGVVEPRLPELGQRSVVDSGELHAGDHRAECGVDRLNSEIGRHIGPSHSRASMPEKNGRNKCD